MIDHILETVDLADLVFLVGAGVSYSEPTRLSTVRHFMTEILRESGASDAEIAIVDGRTPALDVTPRFEVLIDEIRKLNDPMLNVGRVFDSDGYNKNHDFLAKLLKRGVTVITTNFDLCIENAVAHEPIKSVVFNGSDIDSRPATTGVLVTCSPKITPGGMQESNRIKKGDSCYEEGTYG